MSDYQDKIRVRSCGILVKDESVLLVQLRSPISRELIWTPPGGGVRLNEKLEQTEQREFFEETSLTIAVKGLLHINEIIENRFHAIEFFYLVEYVSGVLKLGNDPELSSKDQILEKIEFKNKEELKDIDVFPDYLKEQFWVDYASTAKS